MKTRINAIDGKKLNEYTDWQEMISDIRATGVEPDHFHGVLSGDSSDNVLHGKFYESPFEIGFMGSTLVSGLLPTDFGSLVADSE